jgi:hypothetical protein
MLLASLEWRAMPDDVEAHAVAVNPRLSRHGDHYRFEKWCASAIPYAFHRNISMTPPSRLAVALADYGLAMDFERNQIVAQHREEQTR